MNELNLEKVNEENEKGRKAKIQSEVYVNEEVRILVESDGVKTIQIANGIKEGEIVWKNNGYYTGYKALIKELKKILTDMSLLKSNKHTLDTMLSTLKDSDEYMEDKFEKLGL